MLTDGMKLLLWSNRIAGRAKRCIECGELLVPADYCDGELLFCGPKCLRLFRSRQMAVSETNDDKHHATPAGLQNESR